MRPVARLRHVAGAALWAARTPPPDHSAPPPAPAEAPAPPPAPAEPEWLDRDRRDGENMRRLVSWLLGPEDTAVDIGAHHGSLLTEILRAAPEGRHVALEPLPHLAAELRESFPDVTVHEVAASNRVGTTTFAHVRGAEGWSGLKYRPLPTGLELDPDVREITVELKPLDDLLDHGPPPRLIKIDVEGAEQQVIEGAMRTLSDHRPVVIFEHGSGSAEHFDTLPDDIHRLFTQDARLRIFDLDGNGPYALPEFQRTFYRAERVNFVAKP
jgi:FkbM family methyltransferase